MILAIGPVRVVGAGVALILLVEEVSYIYIWYQSLIEN